jgi:ubiquinone/menaquinone biosynthesis C-methylase UbiE
MNAMWRLTTASNGRISKSSKILLMCGGEGLEGSILCDMGYRNVTISDISERGVAEAIKRDSRLQGLVLNAERADVESNSFEVVIVQDGLHHLQSPVQGFTEMLGNGISALNIIRLIKFILDTTLGRAGNQFCGLILKC